MKATIHMVKIFGGRWDGLELPAVPTQHNCIDVDVNSLENAAGNIGSLRLPEESCRRIVKLFRADEKNFFVGEVNDKPELQA